MYEQPTHIDLTLPRSWNQCTTEQLELIAAAILHHTQRQDRYHPFDWLAVKTELFFLLTETHPLPLPMMEGSDYSASQKDNDKTFLVAFNDRRPWWKRLFAPLHHREGQGEGLFPIYVWQVQSFIEQHLAWIDDPKAAPLLIFPYKQLLWEWHFQLRPPFLKKHYLAPGELLQDFSWQQYRHLQDYMDGYVRASNQALTIQQHPPVDRDRLAAATRQAEQMRTEFLRVLFKAEANSPLSALNSQLKNLSPVRWQVILFWWSGLMHYLQRQYPHCFKQSKKKAPSRQPNPLELYTSIVATMQTQAHLSEEDINGQTFHIVLEQLERLAKQNEEMEKLSKKHS